MLWVSTKIKALSKACHSPSGRPHRYACHVYLIVDGHSKKSVRRPVRSTWLWMAGLRNTFNFISSLTCNIQLTLLLILSKSLLEATHNRRHSFKSVTTTDLYKHGDWTQTHKYVTTVWPAWYQWHLIHLRYIICYTDIFYHMLYSYTLANNRDLNTLFLLIVFEILSVTQIINNIRTEM